MVSIIPNKAKNMTHPLELMCIDPKATMKDKHIEGGCLILKWYCICEQTIKIYHWKPFGRLIIPKNKTKQNKKYI